MSDVDLRPDTLASADADEQQPDPSPAAETSSSRWRLATVCLLLAVPFVIGMCALRGRPYTPMGDEASILFKLGQVGTSHTPLVGVYSTRQWAHPGPILYYLLAGPYRLLGSHPNDMFIGATALNLLSVLLCAYLFYRRRPGRTFFIGAAVIAVLMWGLGSGLLTQVWNPYLPLFPYLAFLLSLWGLADGDQRILPVTAGLASVILQLHVAYLPLVAGGVLTVIAVTVLRLRPSGRQVGRFLRGGPFLWSVGVTALLWLPPVIDQLFGTGNLRRVGSYFKDGHTGNVGYRYGFGLLSDEVGLHGPWSGGHERVIFGNVQPGSLVPLILLLAALVVVSVVLMRQKKSAGLQLLALVQLLVGGVAAAKIPLPLLSYLIVWMLPLAAFCWLALIVRLIDCLSDVSWAAPARSLALPLVILVAVAGGVEVARVSWSMAHGNLPVQEYSAAVSSVLTEMPSVSGQNIRIEGIGEPFNEAWVGVLYGLSRKANDFFTTDGAVGQKWGTQHVWKNQPVSATYTIAVTEPFDYGDPVRRCQQDPRERQVAAWDQLSTQERSELRRLLVLNFAKNGALPAASNRELTKLSKRAFRVAVFAGPTTCGGAP